MKDRLIEYSGGQPRVLMTLIRDSIVSGELPVDAAAVEKAANKERLAYARQLLKEHWEIIEQIREGKSPERNEQNDKIFQDLLASRAILQYRNDKEWYGVNPLVPEREE